MAMNYGPMAYYIEDVPEGESVVEKFPDLLAKADVFCREDDLPEGVDGDKVMRYLIYMFSPNTPLRIDIPDMNIRKNFALNKLNIEADELGEIPSGYSEMCMMNSEWIINRFMTFTRFFRSIAYEKLAIAEVRNFQLATYMLTSKIDKSSDDKNFQQGRKGWYEDIKESLAEIMDGESSKRLEEEIVFKVKMESLGIRPEEFTRFYKDNKMVFPDIIP